MHDSKRTNVLREAILAHLQTVGPCKWNLVRELFPDISNATFWRHVRAVREEATVERQPRSNEIEAPGVSVGATQSENQTVENHPLPAGPFGGWFRYYEQATRFNQLQEDAENLKQQSLGKNGRIKNSAMYAKSIILRERLICVELKALDNFYNINQIQIFHQKMMDAIEKASPEVRTEIIVALGEVNKRPFKV